VYSEGGWGIGKSRRRFIYNRDCFASKWTASEVAFFFDDARALLA
jgi:hypothetical protein